MSTNNLMYSNINDVVDNIHDKLNININSVNKNNRQNGGFSFFKSRETFANVIKNTKRSENNVIDKYKIMYKVVKDYYKSYDEHINNLRKLDTYVNFKGMTKMFTKVINKKYFKHGNVDKTLHILFNNYSINSETSNKQFRKDHIMQQIYYIIDTYFIDKGGMSSVKYIFIDLAKEYFILYITNKEDKTDNFKITHTDYIIDDIEDTIEKIQDILVIDKTKLKQNKEVIKFNNNNNIKSSASNVLSKIKNPHSKSKRGSTSKSKSGSKIKSKSKRGSKSKSKYSIVTQNLQNDINSDRNIHKSKKHSIHMNTINNNSNSDNVSIKQHIKSRSSSYRARDKLQIYKTPSERKRPATVPNSADISKEKALLLSQTNTTGCTALSDVASCVQNKSCVFKDGKCNVKLNTTTPNLYSAPLISQVSGIPVSSPQKPVTEPPPPPVFSPELFKVDLD